jgi:hypothetical protein
MDELKKHIRDNLEKMDIEEPASDSWDALNRKLSESVSGDPLKNHLERHADEWEIDEPDSKAWQQIEKEIKGHAPASAIPLKRIWLYAAACLVVIVGLGIIFYINRMAGDKAGTDLTTVLKDAEIDSPYTPVPASNKPATAGTKPERRDPPTVTEGPASATGPLPLNSPEPSKQRSPYQPHEANDRRKDESTTVTPARKATNAKLLTTAGTNPERRDRSTITEYRANVTDPLPLNRSEPSKQRSLYQPREANERRKDESTAATPARKTTTAQLPSAVVDVQTGYDDLITTQVRHIQSLPLYGENVHYFESFVMDFRRLDHQEKQLQKSIAQQGLVGNSIDELSMIYHQKLMILKKLQAEISKTSNQGRNALDTIPAFIRL